MHGKVSVVHSSDDLCRNWECLHGLRECLVHALLSSLLEHLILEAVAGSHIFRLVVTSEQKYILGVVNLESEYINHDF